MEHLFNLDLMFTPLLILVSMWIIGIFPGRINALYHKENILKKTRFEFLYEMIWLTFNLCLLLYIVITYTFTGILSYVWFSIIVLVLVFFLLVIVVDRINNYKKKTSKKLFTITKIYYGREDIADQMKEVSDKYDGVTFKKSVSDTPIQIQVDIQEDIDIEELLDAVRKEKHLFLDLNEQKYRYKLYVYIFATLFAITYLSILAIYNIF